MITVKKSRTRKATLAERNALFGALEQVKPGQGVLLYAGHRFGRAASEFEAEGLARVETGDGMSRVVRLFH